MEGVIPGRVIALIGTVMSLHYPDSERNSIPINGNHPSWNYAFVCPRHLPGPQDNVVPGYIIMSFFLPIT